MYFVLFHLISSFISRVNSIAVWQVRTPASCRLNTRSFTTTTTRTELSKSFSNRKSSYLTIMRQDYSETWVGWLALSLVVGFLPPIFANVHWIFFCREVFLKIIDFLLKFFIYMDIKIFILLLPCGHQKMK